MKGGGKGVVGQLVIAEPEIQSEIITPMTEVQYKVYSIQYTVYSIQYTL